MSNLIKLYSLISKFLKLNSIKSNDDRTKIEQPINKPFRPSIKFEPFISIAKQKTVNKTLKKEYDKIVLTISFLRSKIFKSLIITTYKSINNCKKNLNLGLDKICLSENKPNMKIQIKGNCTM